MSYSPVWLPTLLTHTGTGVGGSPVTDRSQVKLGKVTNKTFTADTNYPLYDAQGLDYTTVHSVTSAQGGSAEATFFPVRLLGNSGYGGARTKGDGVQYCDMRGSGSGMCSRKARISKLANISQMILFGLVNPETSPYMQTTTCSQLGDSINTSS